MKDEVLITLIKIVELAEWSYILSQIDFLMKKANPGILTKLNQVHF
jgi:hypothetical protein